MLIAFCILWRIQDVLKRRCFYFRISWSLVPVPLRIRQVFKGTGVAADRQFENIAHTYCGGCNVEIACPNNGLHLVEVSDIFLEMDIP